jgi:hypothetical protein
MSNSFISGSGTTIKIGTDAIGDIDQIGTFGGAVTVIKHTPLDGVVYKKAGSRDNGTLTLQGAYVPGDTGQAALKTAFDGSTTDTYSIELSDSGGTNGTTFSFSGVCTQFETGVSGADNKIMLNATIEVTGDITVTAAA